MNQKPNVGDWVGLILTNDWYEGTVNKLYKDDNHNEKVDVACTVKNGEPLGWCLTVPKYIGEVIKK